MTVVSTDTRNASTDICDLKAGVFLLYKGFGFTSFFNFSIIAYSCRKGQRVKGKKNSNIRILAYISQFAINMLVPIFLCSAVGYYIDQKFGTSFFFIILFFVGAVAGARNIYILAKREYTDDGAEEETEDRQDSV